MLLLSDELLFSLGKLQLLFQRKLRLINSFRVGCRWILFSFCLSDVSFLNSELRPSCFVVEISTLFVKLLEDVSSSTFKQVDSKFVSRLFIKELLSECDIQVRVVIILKVLLMWQLLQVGRRLRMNKTFCYIMTQLDICAFKHSFDVNIVLFIKDLAINLWVPSSVCSCITNFLGLSFIYLFLLLMWNNRFVVFINFIKVLNFSFHSSSFFWLLCNSIFLRHHKVNGQDRKKSK